MPKCKKCNDKKYIQKRDGFRECQCLIQEKLELLYLKNNIYTEYHDSSLNQFKVTNECREKAFKFVKNYINHLENRYKSGIGIFFYGDYGTGKTLLMVEILKEALSQNFTAKFYIFADIIRVVTSSWYNEEARREVDLIKNVNFLGIDDIGKEYYDKQKLNVSILDLIFRYRAMQFKPTLFTSNYKPSELSGIYGKGLLSLLKGHVKPLYIDGKDFRKEALRKRLKKYD